VNKFIVDYTDYWKRRPRCKFNRENEFLLECYNDVLKSFERQKNDPERKTSESKKIVQKKHPKPITG
jgi:hypothetical protein